jgi:hypothetical protein
VHLPKFQLCYPNPTSRDRDARIETVSPTNTDVYEVKEAIKQIKLSPRWRASGMFQAGTRSIDAGDLPRSVEAAAGAVCEFCSAEAVTAAAERERHIHATRDAEIVSTHDDDGSGEEGRSGQATLYSAGTRYGRQLTMWSSNLNGNAMNRRGVCRGCY